MSTTIIDMPSQTEDPRIKLRQMTKSQFIEEKASGTLRKNTKVGMNNVIQYLAERAAYEFGYGFEDDWTPEKIHLPQEKVYNQVHYELD